MSPRTLITRGLAATALATTMAIAGIAPASAYSATVYYFATKARCEAKQPAYKSSWTSVSTCQPNGGGWSFRVVYYS
ncbi:hypothetical protein [Kocuria flava]|uniref:hypothetical protein n=1 Tax=Kocuria flava TaxID=446860 RepID=UPI002F943363